MFKTADTPLEPIVYTAQQTAYLMNVSKHQILEMIRRKELRAFKISNKYMVPAEAIHEFIRQRLDEEMGILPDEALDPEDEELLDPEEDPEEEELKAPPSRSTRSKPTAEPSKERPKPAASPFSGTNKHLLAAQEKPAGKTSSYRETEGAGKSAGGKKQAATGKTSATGKKEEPGSTFRPRRPRRYPKSDN